MATGVGMGLDLSGLDKAIKNAEKGFDNLIKKGQKTQEAIVNNFRIMAEEGVGYFANKLNGISSAFENFGKSASRGMQDIASSSSHAVDKVNHLIDMVKSLSYNDYKGQSYSSGAVAKLTYEIEEAMKKLAQLQEKLNFYATGEGSKAIGFYDTSKIVEEANALQRHIELLQQERYELQQIANIKGFQAEQQAKIDAEWQRMEDERIGNIRESAKASSAAAKAESDAWKQSYEEAYRAYERLFDKADEREYAELFKKAEANLRQMQKAEAERYSDWLLQKKREEDEHKRIEDEKYKSTVEAIAKQNAAYAELETRRQQNQQVRDNAVQARANYEATIRMYEQMYAQIDAKEKEKERRYLETQKREEEAAARKAKSVIDQANRELEAYRNAYKQRQQMYEQMWREIERRESSNRRGDYQNAMLGGAGGMKSADNALRYADRIYSGKGLKSLNNMNLAIQKMQQAQQRLNLDTEDGKKKYDELGRRIKQIRDDINKVTGASEELNKKHKSLLDTNGQLARAMAAVFSVSAIKGYVNKLMQIRGEFELQQRSLQVLLQNKDEANALWDKTVALAVKSPYTTKQLVTATKQLAAYRIESEKLYETNKMLADVSIGLGVDMNRLILAFGQVKAANFLRGTELRQFSEAGVNMLDELAKRFTALEGRAVSVGEVFERVSKRMVSFADVEAVFKTITSEGGTFYQMQEKQSETLKGMMLNLKDSYELMLNDIGKSNEGMLKGFVSMMKTLVDNWQLLSEVLKGVGAALVLYKLSVASTNRDLIAMALQMGVVNKTGTKQLTILNLLTLGFKKLTKGVKGAGSAMKAFMTSNAITLFITAIIYALYKLYNAFSKHQEQLEEITKKYSDLRKEVATINVKFTYAENKNELKESLNKLADFAKQNSISVDVNLEGLGEEQLKEKFNNLNNQILNTLAFAESFSKAISNSDIWWQLSDGIIEDFEQFSASAQTLSTTLRNEIYNLVDYLAKTGQLTDEMKDAFKPRNIAGGETELDYIERVSKAYEKYLKTVKATTEETKKGGHAAVAGNYNRLVKLWGKDLYDSIVKTRGAIDDFNAKQKEAIGEFVEFKDELEIPALLNAEARTAYIKAAIDQKAFDDFTKEMWYRLANQYFSVNIAPTTPEKKEISGWMKEYNKFVGTLQQAVDKEGNTLTIVKPMQADTDPTEYLNKLKGTYERLQKDIEAWDAKNAKARAQYTKDEINAIKAQNAERKKAIDWLEYDKKKSKKEESEELKKLKEQIKLVRQLADDYEEMWKKYGKAYADANIKSDARTNAFAELELDIENFAVGSRQDEKNNLGKLLEKALGIEGGKVEVEKAIADVEVEVRWGLQEQANADLSRDIENLFGNYEMSLELEKLNIPKDLASQLFGVEAIDLTSLRKQLLDMVGLGTMADKTNAEILDSDTYTNLNEHQRKELADHLQKVFKMEREHQEKLLKQYSKYLVQAQSERIKIKLDELRQLKEIESLEIGDADKELMRQGVQKDIQKRLDTQAWKDFQESGMYVRLFDNLEGASMHSLDKMENALMGLRDSLKELDPSELKEINNQLEKIRDIKVDKNPFKGLADDAKTYFEYVKNRKEWEASLDASEEKEANIRSEADSQSLLIKSLEDELDLIDQTTDEGIAYALVLESKVELEKEYLKVLLDELEAQGKITREERERIENGQDAGKSIQDRLNKTAQKISAVTSSMADMATNLEAAFGMSDSLKDTFELLQGIGGGVSDMYSGAAGLFSGDPLQMIQGGMQLVSGVSKIFASFNEAHDKRIERKIESEIKLVERLGKLYEKLEKQIEAAYSIDTFQAANDAAKENLEQQIRATERMIEAEKDKKKTDQKRIEEWQEQIEENLEMLEELEAKRLQELGGIGGEDAYKDIAQGFTDAWFDAFLETGNGLDALNDHFDEVLNNMVKKQLTLRATNSFLAPIFEEIDKAVKDTKVTNEEMQNIKELAAQTMPELAAFLENIATEMGMSEFAGKNGELSGLSAGISGITETQADTISAYLNTLRFYVADSNMQLKALVAAQGVNADTPNPMLSQLLVIAEQTRSIRDMFESVIGRGGNNNHGGAYLKVDIG